MRLANIWWMALCAVVAIGAPAVAQQTNSGGGGEGGGEGDVTGCKSCVTTEGVDGYNHTFWSAAGSYVCFSGPASACAKCDGLNGCHWDHKSGACSSSSYHHDACGGEEFARAARSFEDAVKSGKPQVILAAASHSKKYLRVINGSYLLLINCKGGVVSASRISVAAGVGAVRRS